MLPTTPIAPSGNETITPGRENKSRKSQASPTSHHKGKVDAPATSPPSKAAIADLPPPLTPPPLQIAPPPVPWTLDPGPSPSPVDDASDAPASISPAPYAYTPASSQYPHVPEKSAQS